MAIASATLASWSVSWLRGHVGSDDVVAALHSWARMHVIIRQPCTCEQSEGPLEVDECGCPPSGIGDLSDLLRGIRAASEPADAAVQLVLPTPGDVSGLVAGTSFASAAITAGEGVLVGARGKRGLGIVPKRESRDVLGWLVFNATPIPSGADMGLGEAEHAMREATKAAAAAIEQMTLLAPAGAPEAQRCVADQLAGARSHRYPPDMPPRALRILDSVDQVEAIVAAAGQSASRSLTAAAAADFEAHLRPLRATARACARAAVNARR